MKRYIINKKRIMRNDGKLVGHIVRMSDGSSYFEQAKKVPAGHCVNYGPNWA